MLNRLADDVWEAAAPMRFLGFAIGTRMTVIKLPNAGLLLHSPVPLDDTLRKQLDALGEVQHIVAPNVFHHMHALGAQQHYPQAIVTAAAGVAAKQPHLRIDRTLSETGPEAWGDTFGLVTIEGSMLSETVMLHRPSRTLISADLVEYFEHHDEWLTRQYLKLAGVYGQVAWNRLLRLVYRDRKRARASIDRILAWDFDRVTIAHGQVITDRAKDNIAQSFEWL